MKIFTQAPRNEREEQLHLYGYRVLRDENRKYFATAPRAGNIYNGASLDEAWQACDTYDTSCSQRKIEINEPEIPPAEKQPLRGVEIPPTEIEVLRGIYEAAHDLWERTGELMPDSDDVPEWVTFKLLRLAYHDTIVRLLAQHGLELEGSAKNAKN